MLLTVRVKPGSKVPSLSSDGGDLVIAVREPAREGRANEAVRKALAAHFDVALSRVQLVRGASARLKVFRVEG